MAKVVGIVAGGGQFPLLLARSVKQKGHRVAAVGLSGQTSEALASQVDFYREIHVGQLGKLIKLLKGAGVEEVVFAGRVKKPRSVLEARPDLRALKVWRRLRSRNDDHILRAVAEELEAEGLRVVSATEYLDFLLTPEGVLTRRRPTKEEYQDIVFGWSMAKAIGELDIGQCVVVKERVVIAVEAMEGTDATILRAGSLVKEAVVVKVCKPRQDTRFDLPSVGKGTIKTMLEAGARVLALEAGKSLFFDREEALALADEAGLTIVGLMSVNSEQ
jgi:DUF1009 family protein